MEYSHRYPIYPTQEVAAELERHIDIHRQAYNYTRYEYENVDAEDIGSAYKHHYRLPDWKSEFPVLSEVNSKALQRTVTRFYQNLSNLKTQKKNGNKVGKLKWKSPREFQSMTYSQSGFELKNTSGRRASLWLSKIGDIKLRYHREIPDEADIKEVTIKKETTGEWFVSFGLETDDADVPEKPAMDELDSTNSVGIDLGILNYIHTSDGKTVDWLDLEDEYERLRREQRKFSRKQKGSNNYEKQRREVARVKRHIRRKVLDYQHKITTWLVREYDAVFVEDLNVKGMLEDSHNARNKQDAAWRQFISLLDYKADLYGCHVVQIEPEGTTKECASCGVETAKPIWVREHSCPSCGFECDRDANAAMNVLQRGFSELGLGWPEDTPVETALPTDTTSVSAKRVIEVGSLGSFERAKPSRDDETPSASRTT
ncbi:RNA-guided endonuclease InsQ/TnpB family protein [Halanaeroarchaeum sulfurireducens]|uniref:IS1341-type transposase n=1 Tax=Halanaeroarchaeum sulfurireducens TaxID=1604004 RepID=A0A0F7PEE6_9EURY|nr:RNA-guided endonuclease TnpB family protein [Halanaeroarchaeum sulfurireducens]AKH97668.1 IS1341-type transposase [Halanaeroarchaeum sulfurireducens]ALG82063.1 IS1341-type transposase [Halanaeroarchaeum sulfurireducens]